MNKTKEIIESLGSFFIFILGAGLSLGIILLIVLRGAINAYYIAFLIPLLSASLSEFKHFYRITSQIETANQSEGYDAKEKSLSQLDQRQQQNHR